MQKNNNTAVICIGSKTHGETTATIHFFIYKLRSPKTIILHARTHTLQPSLTALFSLLLMDKAGCPKCQMRKIF